MTSKPARVSSSLIGCPIQSALCHIEAKSFVNYNSSPSIGALQKANVIYQFKRPLGDCISENNNIYVGLTSTILLRRLSMHLSDTSSIDQHLKNHSCPTTEFRKIQTENATIFIIIKTCRQHGYPWPSLATFP